MRKIWISLFFCAMACGQTTINRAPLTVADSATKPPLNITARSSAPSSPSSGDIYLDNGANTSSGKIGFRRYSGSWTDLGQGYDADLTTWAGITPSSAWQDILDGTVTTQTNQRLIRQELAVASYDVTTYGAVGDGATDATTAVSDAHAAAVAAGGGTIFFPEGTYLIHQAVSLTCSADVKFAGEPGTIIKLDAGHFALLPDVADDALTLGGNVDSGDVTVDVDSTASLEVGDMLYIWTTITAETGWSTVKKEIHSIQAIVDADTVTIAEPLRFSYATTDAGLNLKAYSKRSIAFEEIAFQQTGDRMTSLSYFNGVTLRDCSWTDLDSDQDGTSLLVQRCKNVQIEKCHWELGAYGLNLATAREAVVRDCTARYVDQHPITITEWSDGVIISGLHSSSCGASMDSHPAFNVHYVDCIGLAEESWPNHRSLGGSVRNCYYETLNTSGGEVYFQNCALAVDTGLYAKSSFEIDGLTVRAPLLDDDAGSSWGFYYGERLTIRGFEVTESNDLPIAGISTYPGKIQAGIGTGFDEITISDSRLFKLSIWSDQKANISNCVFLSPLLPNNRAVSQAFRLRTDAHVNVSNCTIEGYDSVCYQQSTLSQRWNNCHFIDCTAFSSSDSVALVHYFNNCWFEDVASFDSADVLAGAKFLNCSISGTTPTLATDSSSHSYGSGTTAWTMTYPEASATRFTVTLAGGAVDAVFPVVVPGKMFTVYNNSGQTVTFKVTGQTGFAVANGKRAIGQFNSTDCEEIYEQP
jgi:hypothetical protein